jgi:hypothetical protein
MNNTTDSPIHTKVQTNNLIYLESCQFSDKEHSIILIIIDDKHCYTKYS